MLSLLQGLILLWPLDRVGEDRQEARPAVTNLLLPGTGWAAAGWLLSGCWLAAALVGLGAGETLGKSWGSPVFWALGSGLWAMGPGPWALGFWGWAGLAGLLGWAGLGLAWPDFPWLGWAGLGWAHFERV